jgi:thioredoxin 1
MVVEITDLGTISKGDVLVDFYTSTCGPCRAMNPILEEVSREMPQVRVAKVEVTRCPDATQVFGIQSVPTVMFLQNSKVREVSHGLTSKKNLLSMVQRHLAPAIA